MNPDAEDGTGARIGGRMNRLLGVFVALSLAVSAGGAVGSASARQQLPIKYVKIGTTSYLAADMNTMASRLVRWPGLKAVLAAVRQCRGASAWGFVSRHGAGIAAWVPVRISGCFPSTSGGGPATGSSFTPCFQLYLTTNRPDPTGVSNGAAVPAHRAVLIAATNTQTCADLSTQVPGGVWGTHSNGRVVIIKCQYVATQGLADYLVLPIPNFKPPTSRPTYVAYDRNVDTGGATWLSGVPHCGGVHVAL
jgi:hypothetical protein